MVKFRNHGCKDLYNLSRKFSVVHISLPRNFELSVFACSFRGVALAHLNSKEDVARTKNIISGVPTHIHFVELVRSLGESVSLNKDKHVRML